LMAFENWIVWLLACVPVALVVLPKRLPPSEKVPAGHGGGGPEMVKLRNLPVEPVGRDEPDQCGGPFHPVGFDRQRRRFDRIGHAAGRRGGTPSSPGLRPGPR
jgi:hypothetical protein